MMCFPDVPRLVERTGGVQFIEDAARVDLAFSVYESFHGERAGCEHAQAEDLEWSKSEVAVRRRHGSVLHGGGHHASTLGPSLVFYDF